jgi:hypothetical protein
MKYEVWQSGRDRQWYWQARTLNHNVVTDGVGYPTQNGAMQVIGEVKFSAAAEVQVISERESRVGVPNIFTDTEALLSLKHIPKK